MALREERDKDLRTQLRGGLESPFLEEEIFPGESVAVWEPRFAALEAESPFQRAFEEGLTNLVEPDQEEEFGEEVEGLDRTELPAEEMEAIDEEALPEEYKEDEFEEVYDKEEHEEPQSAERIDLHEPEILPEEEQFAENESWIEPEQEERSSRLEDTDEITFSDEKFFSDIEEDIAPEEEEADWEVLESEEISGIPAGREELSGSDIPLLRGHDGPGPHLIISWNQMKNRPQSVDVVIHLHGYKRKSTNLKSNIEPISGLNWSDPEGHELGPHRVRPTLTLLPKGHFVGGKTGKRYDFPALITETGLQNLVSFGLNFLAQQLGILNLGLSRLIVTAHSGGGEALLKILSYNDPHEVHIFDGLYQDGAALVRWAKARIKRDLKALEGVTSDAVPRYMREQGGALRVLFRPGTPTQPYSLPVHRAVTKMIPVRSELRKWYRVEQTEKKVGHDEIPRRYGWRLLADAGADLPRVSAPRPSKIREVYEDESVQEVEFTPVPVENPGGGRVKNKRDPSPEDIEIVSGYGGKSIELHKLAAAAWRALVAEARREEILKPLLLPTSGYRSTQRQAELFKAAVKRYGSESEARKWVAPPGGSAHHSGRAIDFYLGGSNSSGNVSALRKLPAYLWLTRRAKEFGFYPYVQEPWHWEYNPPASGYVSSTTAATLGSIPSPSGTKPPAELVRFAQQVLNAAEGERLKVDGALGPLTRDALERFRKKYGIGAGGVIDDKTKIALAQRALEEIRQQSLFGQFGVLDTATREALATFKSEHGLGTDAALDAATRTALAEALERRASPQVVATPAPSATSGTDWARITPGKRMLYVMERLVQGHGYPANGAGGLVGNLWAESGVIPNRIEGSKPDSPMRAQNFAGVITDFTPEQVMQRVSGKRGPRRPGIGLAQWTSANRRKGLFDHKFQGRVLGAAILYDMDAQIDYLVSELGSLYKRVNRVLRNPQVSLEEASDEVVYGFEIPGSILTRDSEGKVRKRSRTDPAVVKVFDRRREFSRKALKVYRDKHS